VLTQLACPPLAFFAAGAEPGPDVASMIHSYGRKFLHHDSSVALQYYMLAAVVRGNSIAVKGQVRVCAVYACVVVCVL